MEKESSFPAVPGENVVLKTAHFSLLLRLETAHFQHGATTRAIRIAILIQCDTKEKPFQRLRRQISQLFPFGYVLDIDVGG